MSSLLSPLEGAPGITWSACVIDPATGDVLDSYDAERVLPTESVGKLLLLLEVARRLTSGDLAASALLRRTPDDEVADSGLWQHLRVDALPVEDLAVLVASVSDNLATNVLLREVGLDAVAAVGPSLGLATLRLHDRVRGVRTDEHAPTLSEGSALDLARFAALLATEESLEWSLLRRWLSTGVDLSLVAGDLGLDPLAHVDEDRGLRLLNKTGADAGVRADVGILGAGGRVLAYAVVASWTPTPGDVLRDDGIRAMRAVGAGLGAPG